MSNGFVGWALNVTSGQSPAAYVYSISYGEAEGNHTGDVAATNPLLQVHDWHDTAGPSCVVRADS